MFDDESEEDFLVYAHKKSGYVQLAIIRVRPPSGARFPDVLHQSIRSPECSFAGATSITVVDEFLVREFLEESHIEMMDDPIAKLRGEYLSDDRFFYDETDGSSLVIGSILEIIDESEEIFFEFVFEFEDIHSVPLVFPRIVISTEDILECEKRWHTRFII